VSSATQRPFMPEVKEDEDAHAHSPRRPSYQDVGAPDGFNTRRNPDYEDYWANQSMPPPQARLDTAAWNQPQHGESSIIRQNGPLADPFLEPRGLSTVTSRRGLKKSSEDTPMPDVPNCEPIRNISGMTGISYEQKDVPANNIATHEAIMNQLVEALSPLKSDDDGPHGPGNTPSSARVFSKPSASAKGRAASRRLSGSRAVSPGVQKRGKVTGDSGRKASTKVISANPGSSVQSKKEGEDNKENTPDTRVAGADFTRRASLATNVIGNKSSEKIAGSSDSKRKRPLEDVSTSPHRKCNGDSVPSSPSKKLSKMISAEVLRKDQSPHTPEEGRDVGGGVSLRVAGEEK
jgi:hypothetical protein